jgi:hypothetical protein
MEIPWRRPSMPVAVVMVAVATAAGCLFEPRTPESSGGNTVVCFSPVPADQDNEVFYNVEGALGCKIANTYQVQFASDFIFVPAPSVAANFPAAFGDQWTFEDEVRFVGTLFSTADSVVSNLDAFIYDETRTGTGGNLISYEADYFVRYVPRGAEASVYRGRAKYTLRTVGGNFVISSWVEFEPGQGDLAFGQLRGELYQ